MIQCDYCDEEPISGTRWHCITCQDRSVDFCSDCFVTQTQETNHHPLDHIIIGYRASTDYQVQSDEDSDDDEQNEHSQDDTIDDDAPEDVSCDDFNINLDNELINQTNTY